MGVSQCCLSILRDGTSFYIFLSILFFRFVYRHGSAIILLVFHSPFCGVGVGVKGGGGAGVTQHPFSLLPLTVFKPMQAQAKQEVLTP